MKKTLQTFKKAGIYSAFFGVSLMSAQTTYTFTNASATGRFGPTTPQINAAYLATNLNNSVTVTGGIQSFTIPNTGIYKINAYGAKGGNGAGLLGGNGAQISGQFTLTAGTVLKLLVGQLGGSRGNPGDPNSAGAGGGGSFVTYTNNIALVVAGGGGGAGSSLNGMPGSTSLNGSNSASSAGLGGINGGGGGAGLSGTAGTSLTPGGDGSSCSYGAGGGGFYTRGGYNCSGGAPLINGDSFIAGGFGGAADAGRAGVDGGFGGGAGVGHRASGGGGWSGGGGDGNTDGGGGGGSYNSGTNQINTTGVNTGNGYIVITSLFGVAISQTSTISCNSYSTAVLSSTVSGGVAPYTYSWVPSGGTASVTTGIPAGTYTCFVLDAGFNFASSTFTVTQPTAVIAGVASQSNVTCYGSNNGAITLTTTTGGTAPYSYTWSPTGGNTVTATGLVANVYSCIVKDANNCSASSAPTATITQPAAFINASSSNSVICAGETATLTATGATSYTWSTGATSPAIVISPSVTTTYTVTGLLAGCTNSLTGTQTVNACTGINEVTASLITVYPNPNNGIVNITLTTALAQNSTLEIYDALGKLVVKQVLAKELNTVNMSNLDNGIYVFKVLNNNNTVKIGKLIKQ